MPISCVVLPGSQVFSLVTPVCGCTHGAAASLRACIGHASPWHAGHAHAPRAALPLCACPWWHALLARAMSQAALLHHSLMRHASFGMSDMSPGLAAFRKLLLCVFSVRLASPESNHRSVQPLQRCVGVCVRACPGVAAHTWRCCRLYCSHVCRAHAMWLVHELNIFYSGSGVMP